MAVRTSTFTQRSCPARFQCALCTCLVIVGEIGLGLVIVSIVVVIRGRTRVVQRRRKRTGARIGGEIEFTHSLNNHLGLHGVLLQRLEARFSPRGSLPSLRHSK